MDVSSLTPRFLQEIPLKSSLVGYPCLSLYLLAVLLSVFIEGTLGVSLVAFLMLAFFTHALLFLLTVWSFSVRLHLRYRPSPFSTATHAHVVLDGTAHIVPLHAGPPPHIFVNYRKYLYSVESNLYTPVTFPDALPLSSYTSSASLSSSIIPSKLATYGLNRCSVLVPTFFDLYLEQLFSPFFVLQAFCSVLWMLDQNPFFSGLFLVVSAVFEALTTVTRLKNYASFRQMAARKPSDEFALRDGVKTKVDSDNIFPGDIIVIHPGAAVADCVVVRGMCVANEAILTGESTPHMKEPLETIVDARTADSPFDATTYKNHVVFGGTEIVQAEDCLGYVLRTGFETAQGSLLRTIISSTEHKTVNNKESFAVILFLLVFAVAAAAYVFVDGIQTQKEFWPLVLSCALIISNVIPPELPFQLANTVNYSLVSLKKIFVYCTEPFRIPLAGCVDVCAFDKTGTLTDDAVAVAGVAGLPGDAFRLVSDPSELPHELRNSLACCNSLSRVGEDIIGDPAERAALLFAKWKMTSDGRFIPVVKSSIQISPVQRFPFSSLLKRMAVVVTVQDFHHGTKRRVAVVKGAPEVMAERFADRPEQYDNVYRHFTLQGMRVLVVGYKEVDAKAERYDRDAVETGLTFGCFVMFTTSIKKESAETVATLKASGHDVVMITGDNINTAAHVARQLGIVGDAVQLARQNDDWEWCDMEGIVVETFRPQDDPAVLMSTLGSPEFCLTGETLALLDETASPQLADAIVARTRVFARMTPGQKEDVVARYQAIGKTVLMCGDGTNDVGALKRADVGVAILNTLPSEQEVKAAEAIQLGIVPMPAVTPRRLTPEEAARRRAMTPQQRQELMREELVKAFQGLSDEDDAVARFGDASMAAPLSCKSVEITPVTRILMQGRCTLVTTQQMFRILALNCISMAYELSVLRLERVKNSEMQLVLTGVLTTICLLVLTNTKPLDKLSPTRPTKTIFAPFHVLSVLSQAAIHFASIQLALHLAKAAAGPSYKPPEDETAFTPSIVNTVVFLMTNVIAATTLAVNYVGLPYRQSMLDNKPLLYSLVGVAVSTVLFVFEAIPELNAYFGLVPFPTPELRLWVVGCIAADVALCFVVERLLRVTCRFNR